MLLDYRTIQLERVVHFDDADADTIDEAVKVLKKDVTHALTILIEIVAEGGTTTSEEIPCCVNFTWLRPELG